MSPFLSHLIRFFDLHTSETAQNGEVDELVELVEAFPRGGDFIRLYREYDMGWREYSLILPLGSEHYNAGTEIALGTWRLGAILRNARGLESHRVLSSFGLFAIGDDGVGSGDRFYLSLADTTDFNLYCLYDGDEATADMADIQSVVHKTCDYSDADLCINEDLWDDPPGP